MAQGADDVARLQDAARGQSTVGGAAEAEVAQIVGEDVVAGGVQDRDVRDEVDLDVVAGGGVHRTPGFEMGGQPRAAEPPWMVDDHDGVRALGRHEPSLQGRAVLGGEGDVLELQPVLGRRAQDG
ncbi:hypothetical protein [Actinoallomurus iriomotensis]|uniref:Uncharacterized protein n=1 Tax=Actinoallomurus iriomotensis TaxID=478107 RepID=A0A9W6S280_9ACTN|nr:hypothetical protein [Actinoallomurus iriomotensis]GLY84417.1 hypothetical protein Airi02_023460 [Actinoallomurus iriomotensis]